MSDTMKFPSARFEALLVELSRAEEAIKADPKRETARRLVDAARALNGYVHDLETAQSFEWQMNQAGGR